MPTSKSKEINADIVVSCYECDNKFVKDYFVGALKKAGFEPWFADSPDKLKDNGLAILQSKIFLTIMSEEGVESEKFNNELSLAYVANKSIFPIARRGIRHINPKLSGGVKLMLAKINWTFFTKPESYADMMPKLVDAINVELKEREERTAPHDEKPSLEETDVYDALNKHAPDIDIQCPDYELEEGEAQTCEHILQSSNCDFWDRHFRGKQEVQWTEFKAKFLEDYEEQITRQLGGGKDTWLTLMLYKDIFELKKVVTHRKYIQFCGKNSADNPDLFFDRIKDYAVGISCMRNIFNMDSSVRLVAIQNLGSFQTPSVITLLFDLVEDTDPNVRALASLALAKTGKKSSRIQDRLIKLLTDEDRVVRESACLSLANMKCTKAIGPILERWRNDAIKHVRDAAELALSRMGGAEAEQAIKVTQVLTSEMQALRSQGKTQ